MSDQHRTDEPEPNGLDQALDNTIEQVLDMESRIFELESALKEIRGIVEPPVTSPEAAREKIEQLAEHALEE